MLLYELPSMAKDLNSPRHGFPARQRQLPFESTVRHDHEVRVGLQGCFLSGFVVILKDSHELIVEYDRVFVPSVFSGS